MNYLLIFIDILIDFGIIVARTTYPHVENKFQLRNPLAEKNYRHYIVNKNIIVLSKAAEFFHYFKHFVNNVAFVLSTPLPLNQAACSYCRYNSSSFVDTRHKNKSRNEPCSSIKYSNLNVSPKN